MRHTIGTVLKRTKSFYYVDIEGDVQLCRIKGNLFQNGSTEHTVAVGDRVEVDPSASEDAGWIYRILPRFSQLSRPSREGRMEQVIVSNIENLLIVASLKKPSFRSGLVDRFLITAQRGNLQPTIIINKLDLGNPEEVKPIKDLYESLGVPVIFTSTKTREGEETLKGLLVNHTSVLSGHSGVGKSSLLKMLFPDWSISIGKVNQTTHKGRHTTTLAEMYPLPEGGYVVDTPGIRELGLYEMEPEELGQYFVEFENIQQACHFKACTHIHEPKCEVKKAVEAGTIHMARYESYCQILRSLTSNV